MAKLTAHRRREFLRYLGEGASVSRAASAIGVSRNAVYLLRDRDESFRLSWEQSVDQGVDRLEDEALRRAVEGYDQPVFYRGVLVGQIRRYSDNLLVELLRSRRPEKFGSHWRQAVREGENSLASLFAQAMGGHEDPVENGRGD